MRARLSRRMEETDDPLPRGAVPATSEAHRNPVDDLSPRTLTVPARELGCPVRGE
jgi:hypothetical protein